MEAEAEKNSSVMENIRFRGRDNLRSIASLGKWEELRRVIGLQSSIPLPDDYFYVEYGSCNFIQVALEAQEEEVVKVALENLAAEIVLKLLRHTDKAEEEEEDHVRWYWKSKSKANSSKSMLIISTGCGSWNPLHYAALRGFRLVKLLVEYYQRYASEEQTDDACPPPPPPPPWLLVNDNGDTPLHVAMTWLPSAGEYDICPLWEFHKKNYKRLCFHTDLISTDEATEIALYLLSLDMDVVLSMANKEGWTPLFCAVMKGFHPVAERILTSSYPYTLIGPAGLTLLHFVPASSENVLKLLLEKHVELLKNSENGGMYTVLHKWAEIGKLWPLRYLEEHDISSLMDMICSVDHEGATPLHVALGSCNIEFADTLLDIYMRERSRGRKQDNTNSGSCPLWAMKDDDGDTAFHTGLLRFAKTNSPELLSKMAQLLSKMISEDPTICCMCNDEGESLLFNAVRLHLDPIVNRLLELSECQFFCIPTCDNGDTVLHLLSSSSETAQLVVEKFWWLAKTTDKRGETPLERAHRELKFTVAELLSKVGAGMTKKAPFDWTAAAKGGYLSDLLAYVDICPDFLRICLDKHDTPLHHIKLKSYNEYQQFLAKPIVKEMMNMCDYDDATPLHRALKRKDNVLAELLLSTEGVNKTLVDKNSNTVIDLLAELAEQDQEWEDMYIRILGVNPRLKTAYIHASNTNLGEIRTTLSVIAALLATLTFAAGFTVPGGVNSDTGEAILAKKVSFIVFLLADTFAMCSSMLVLFCLMWSMVCDPNMMVRLIDHSVVILMLALYGTLLAFASGVYTVIFHKTLWVAIFIFVICSLVGIAAHKTVLFKVLNKLLPSGSKAHRDRIRLLEQGQASEDDGRFSSQKTE